LGQGDAWEVFIEEDSFIFGIIAEKILYIIGFLLFDVGKMFFVSTNNNN